MVRCLPPMCGFFVLSGATLKLLFIQLWVYRLFVIFPKSSIRVVGISLVICINLFSWASCRL